MWSCGGHKEIEDTGGFSNDSREPSSAWTRSSSGVALPFNKVSMQVRTAEINGELRERLRGPFRQPEPSVPPIFKPKPSALNNG